MSTGDHGSKVDKQDDYIDGTERIKLTVSTFYITENGILVSFSCVYSLARHVGTGDNTMGCKRILRKSYF